MANQKWWNKQNKIYVKYSILVIELDIIIIIIICILFYLKVLPPLLDGVP